MEIRPAIAEGSPGEAAPAPAGSAATTATTVRPSGVEPPVAGRTPPPDAPVMKAIPVEPQPAKPIEIQKAQPVEIRKAVPAGPLDEESDESLLKAATPPPADLDE